ncbi:hypothetical protein [Runella zeae]|uniref:hypothetical protein n=1 Tax=Runella zeae TaxID=94255 RepID=UPI001B7FA6AE|nr:hypothetical protein [Runella zeae]
MNLQTFIELENELQFKSITFGDSEGWCDINVWEDALKQMEAITDKEITFHIVKKENTLEILINSSKVFTIESPNDNFANNRIIADLNKKLEELGISKKFYSLTVDGIEFVQDPIVSVGFMNYQTYEKIATLGFGDETEYDWTDEGIIWKGNH